MPIELTVFAIMVMAHIWRNFPLKIHVYFMQVPFWMDECIFHT